MFTYVIHVKAGIDNKSPLWLKYVVTGDVDQLQIFSNQNRTLFSNHTPPTCRALPKRSMALEHKVSVTIHVTVSVPNKSYCRLLPCQ